MTEGKIENFVYRRDNVGNPALSHAHAADDGAHPGLGDTLHMLRALSVAVQGLAGRRCRHDRAHRAVRNVLRYERFRTRRHLAPSAIDELQFSFPHCFSRFSHLGTLHVTHGGEFHIDRQLLSHYSAVR